MLFQKSIWCAMLCRLWNLAGDTPLQSHSMAISPLLQVDRQHSKQSTSVSGVYPHGVSKFRLQAPRIQYGELISSCVIQTIYMRHRSLRHSYCGHARASELELTYWLWSCNGLHVALRADSMALPAASWRSTWMAYTHL